MSAGQAARCEAVGMTPPQDAHRLRSQAVLGVLDAGVSSVGNFAISLIGARYLDIASFGLFATAMVIAILAVGVIKVTVLDPYTLTYSNAEPTARSGVARGVLCAAGLLGLVSALALLVVGLVLSATEAAVSAVVVALAVAVPGMTLQDAARWICYANRAASQALGNTTIWTVGSLLGAVVLGVMGGLTAAAAIYVWGLTAAVAAIVAIARADIIPGRRRLIAVEKSMWRLAPRTVADYLLTQVGGLGGGLVVAGAAGASAFGAMRIAQLPLAAAPILIQAIVAVLQPATIALIGESKDRRARRLTALVALSTSMFVVLTGLVAALLPAPVMAWILGPNWDEARPLVIVLAVSFAAGTTTAAYGVLLRALGEIDYTVKVRALLTVPALLATVAASHFLGALGGCLALACGAVVMASIMVVRATRAGRRCRD